MPRRYRVGVYVLRADVGSDDRENTINRGAFLINQLQCFILHTQKKNTLKQATVITTKPIYFSFFFK